VGRLWRGIVWLGRGVGGEYNRSELQVQRILLEKADTVIRIAYVLSCSLPTHFIHSHVISSASARTLHATPFKQNASKALTTPNAKTKEATLPPHAYKTADDAYRAMMRGLETDVFFASSGKGRTSGKKVSENTIL
jgi:hypothetical protein